MKSQISVMPEVGHKMLLARNITRTKRGGRVVGYVNNEVEVTKIWRDRIFVNCRVQNTSFSVTIGDLKDVKTKEPYVRDAFIEYIRPYTKFIFKEFLYNGTRADVFTVDQNHNAIEYEIKANKGAFADEFRKQVVFNKYAGTNDKHKALKDGKLIVHNFYMVMPESMKRRANKYPAYIGIYLFNKKGNDFSFYKHRDAIDLSARRVSSSEIKKMIKSPRGGVSMVF